MAKTNVLTYGHDLWWRTFQDVAKEYPDIKTDYNHVDACCMWMVKNPEYYDVIVTTNMFGDIITDLAGILQGGMGVAAGGNINPEPGGASMFEPMGGSAPKYTGNNMINPIAAISAAAMLLEHTGYEQAGAAGDAGHPERHRHQDEKPGRRQDGLQHPGSRRPGGARRCKADARPLKLMKSVAREPNCDSFRPCLSFRFDRTLALVTGGSRGLGRPWPRIFAQAGADVVLSSRHEDELAPGGRADPPRAGRPREYVVADMTRRDDVERLADEAVAGWARSTSWSTTPAATSRRRSTDRRRRSGTSWSS